MFKNISLINRCLKGIPTKIYTQYTNMEAEETQTVSYSRVDELKEADLFRFSHAVTNGCSFCAMIVKSLDKLMATQNANNYGNQSLSINLSECQCSRQVLLRAMQTMWKPDLQLDFVIAEQITRWAGKNNLDSAWPEVLLTHWPRMPQQSKLVSSCASPRPRPRRSGCQPESLFIERVNEIDINSIRMTLLCKCLEPTLIILRLP